ncbi:MAG: TIGR00645 family protein [Actinomycetales bacterium]|nr:TIGR00645 family protein [Actinomycetales bacterium]
MPCAVRERGQLEHHRGEPVSDTAPKPSPNLGYLIFASRWLQVPLYLGLIVAQALYVWQFLKELWHLFESVVMPNAHVADAAHAADGLAEITAEAQIMLAVLGLVDVVMIANLLIMVIIGGYETFVSRIRLDQHPDQPEWLSHVNANVLKTKLAMSIIGISSIHLLRSFILADRLENDTLLWQTIIHIAFILSAMALAWIDKVGQRPHLGPAAHGAAAAPTAPATGAATEPVEGPAPAATVVP